MLAELYDAMREDDEDVWFLSLASVTWLPQKLGDGGSNLELVLRLDVTGKSSSLWTIACRYVLDYRFVAEQIDAIEHVTDPAHPLLSRYRDLHGTLFFRGGAAAPDEVIAALWTEHGRSCGDWTPLDEHLREDAAVVLAAGHGLLARGPVPVLERYAAVLTRLGIEPSVVGGQPFKEWRGGAWQPRERPAEALLLGPSFVVADGFHLARRQVA